MRLRLIPIILLTVLGGCATTSPLLTRVADGRELAFTIKASRKGGEMTAQDTATGEVFSGTYTRINRGQGMTFGSIYGMKGQPLATGASFTGPTSSTGRGILIGDKGAVIELALDIAPTGKFRGHGTGIDNQGRRYVVQF